MPEAPRKRPVKHTVVGSFRAHLRARPGAVFTALDGRMRPRSGSTSLYTADPVAFFIIAQGHWWYRGEYRMVPDETGSNLEYVIVNVAQHARALSRLTSRRVRTSAPAEFELLVGRLRREVE
jgi:hypothetical protein